MFTSEGKMASKNILDAQEAATKLSGEILVAEDVVMNQMLIQRFLEKLGAKVTLADNGVVAVNLAQQHHYDLVYMDMQMPLMSGVDAVRQLREMNYMAPIVMLTANATLEDRNICREAGCNDFLTKPINREQLTRITEQYLKTP